MSRSRLAPRGILAAALAAALAPLLLPPAPARAQPGALRQRFEATFVGKPAPAFELKDRQGRTVRLANYRGKVVLLNFWFSTCGPCRMETPDLITLHHLYKDRGLVILGINLDSIVMPQDQGYELERFLKSYPISYPVLIADAKVFNDYGGIPVQPTTFLVDRSGKIVRLFWGASPGAAFERAIRPYLAAPAGRPAHAAP
jgi:peroxiredoxin